MQEAASKAYDADPKMSPEAAEALGRPLRILRCLQTRATGPVSPAAGQGTLLVPLRPGCLQGIAPPTMAFDVTVTADVPGAAPAVQRIPVTLAR